MELNQLAAKLKATFVDPGLPIQIYDFTDIFQITQIALDRFVIVDGLSDSLFAYELVADSQTREVTVKEFINSLNVLVATAHFSDQDMVVLLPDGTRHALAGVEFHERNQAYAITLDPLGSRFTVLEKNIFVSFNDWEPLI